MWLPNEGMRHDHAGISDFNSLKSVVRTAGLEPAPSFEEQILSPRPSISGSFSFGQIAMNFNRLSRVNRGDQGPRTSGKFRLYLGKIAPKLHMFSGGRGFATRRGAPPSTDGVLRDANVISRDAVSTIFVGSAAIMDAIESEDDATAQTLAASRSYLEELARNFGIEIPQKG
jgi:hypothetical protein